MPIILHNKPEKPSKRSIKQARYEDGSSWIENLLVRIGIGIMTGIAGCFFGFYFARYSSAFKTVFLCGGAIGFVVGFVMGDNLPEDWFERIFGGRFD